MLGIGSPCRRQQRKRDAAATQRDLQRSRLMSQVYSWLSDAPPDRPYLSLHGLVRADQYAELNIVLARMMGAGYVVRSSTCRGQFALALKVRGTASSSESVT